MMLHTVTLKSSRAPVVHVHRERHGNRALGVRRPFCVVLVNVQVIGDDAKLLASHLKNFVVINRVHRWIRATLSLHGKAAICAGRVASSTAKLWSAAAGPSSGERSHLTCRRARPAIANFSNWVDLAFRFAKHIHLGPGFQKDRFGRMPKPARYKRALPGLHATASTRVRGRG